MEYRNWEGISRELNQNLIARYIVLTVATSTIFAAAMVLLNPTVESENVRSLLTTLATAEASVLAIVFSVTVVAMQPVISRYSARLTTLFVKDPLFRTTFALFVGSIAFNLLVVYLLPAQNGRLTNAAVGIAFALATVSTVALYRFIQMMIQRSSPDEFIPVFVDRELAPGEYLPETVSRFNELERHPIRPLYQTISRAIELNEPQTAEQGIKGLRTVLTRTFAHLKNERELSNEDVENESGPSDENTEDDPDTPNEDVAKYATTVSDEVLTEYVPAILEQAYAHEQYELVSEGVDDIEAIAQDGLERDFPGVAEKTAEGLGDAFDLAPQTWEGNRLRKPTKESLVRLTTTTAAKADYPTFISVSHTLNQQITVLLRRRPDQEVTDRLVEEYYSQDVVVIFEALLDCYASEIQNKEINWIYPTENQDQTLPEEAVPLRDFWGEYVKFIQAVLRYRNSEGEYPFAEGLIVSGWKGSIEKAAEEGVDGLATLCCVSTIQSAYSADQIEDGRLRMWTNNLGYIRHEYDPSIVDRAFELLKDGERPKGQDISVQTTDLSLDTDDTGFFERLFGPEQKETSFNEWLTNFEQKVHERTEYLRERESNTSETPVK